MKLFGEDLLVKLKAKNRGNVILCREIDKLISDLEGLDVRETKLKDIRKDADCVYDGCYFFNIRMHRAFVLIIFAGEGEAMILWAGNHREYEDTFKNNKSTIEKWLREREYIE